MWGVPATGGGSTPVSPRVTDSVQLGVEVAQQLCGWGCHDLKSSQDALVWQHIARSSSQRTGLQQTCITHTPHQTSYHIRHPIRRTSHHTYIASRQTYITSDTSHHTSHHVQTCITSDPHHIRHTSHITLHYIRHISHQTHMTSDIHHIRDASHQKHITTGEHGITVLLLQLDGQPGSALIVHDKHCLSKH